MGWMADVDLAQCRLSKEKENCLFMIWKHESIISVVGNSWPQRELCSETLEIACRAVILGYCPPCFSAHMKPLSSSFSPSDRSSGRSCTGWGPKVFLGRLCHKGPLSQWLLVVAVVVDTLSLGTTWGQIRSKQSAGMSTVRMRSLYHSNVNLERKTTLTYKHEGLEKNYNI